MSATYSNRRQIPSSPITSTDPKTPEKTILTQLRHNFGRNLTQFWGGEVGSVDVSGTMGSVDGCYPSPKQMGRSSGHRGGCKGSANKKPPWGVFLLAKKPPRRNCQKNTTLPGCFFLATTTKKRENCIFLATPGWFFLADPFGVVDYFQSTSTLIKSSQTDSHKIYFGTPKGGHARPGP